VCLSPLDFPCERYTIYGRERSCRFMTGMTGPVCLSPLDFPCERYTIYGRERSCRFMTGMTGHEVRTGWLTNNDPRAILPGEIYQCILLFSLQRSDSKDRHTVVRYLTNFIKILLIAIFTCLKVYNIFKKIALKEMVNLNIIIILFPSTLGKSDYINYILLFKKC